MMGTETTLTGCHHTEDENIFQEYVCAYCEDEKHEYIKKLEATIEHIKAIEISYISPPTQELEDAGFVLVRKDRIDALHELQQGKE